MSMVAENADPDMVKAAHSLLGLCNLPVSDISLLYFMCTDLSCSHHNRTYEFDLLYERQRAPEPPRVFPCDKCDKVFGSQQALDDHKRDQ